jgi:hypothetical protein
MNNAKNQSPVGAVSSEFERKFKAIGIHPKGFEKAVEAELRERASMFADLFGGPLCTCCERTVDEIGEPCRKTLEQRYQDERHRYETDPLTRHHVDLDAQARMIEAITTPPAGSKAQ